MDASNSQADILSALEGQIVAAERALLAATGGQNVCRLDREGRATGGVKYDEGRLVALRAARRLLRSVEPAQAATSLRRLHAQWRADLQAHQRHERPALPWLAYTQGGVDALEQLGLGADSATLPLGPPAP